MFRRNVSTAVMGEEEIQCVSCGMILSLIFDVALQFLWPKWTEESNQKCTKCKEVVPRNESTKYADHAGITALHAVYIFADGSSFINDDTPQAVQKAGFLEIVRLLLARGAIVNARTRKVYVSHVLHQWNDYRETHLCCMQLLVDTQHAVRSHEHELHCLQSTDSFFRIRKCCERTRIPTWSALKMATHHCTRQSEEVNIGEEASKHWRGSILCILTCCLNRSLWHCKAFNPM